jgi:hypothetical protein
VQGSASSPPPSSPSYKHSHLIHIHILSYLVLIWTVNFSHVFVSESLHNQTTSSAFHVSRPIGSIHRLASHRSMFRRLQPIYVIKQQLLKTTKKSKETLTDSLYDAKCVVIL